MEFLLSQLLSVLFIINHCMDRGTQVTNTQQRKQMNNMDNQDEYNLGEIFTLMNTYTRHNRSILSNELASLHDIYKNKLGSADQVINVPEIEMNKEHYNKKYSDNISLSKGLLFFFCKNIDIYRKYNTIHAAKMDIVCTHLNLKQNLCQGYIESRHINCISCGSVLKSKINLSDSKKGSTCLVIQHINEGPTIKIHLIKKCIKCNIQYWYDRIIFISKTNTVTRFENNRKYFALTKSTIVHKECFRLQDYWTLNKYCNPGSIYQHINITFDKQIQMLNKKLESAAQNCGNRRSVMITEDILHESWFLYKLIDMISTVIAKNKFVEIDKNVLQQNKPKEIFIALWNKYKKFINNYDGTWIQKWPIKIDSNQNIIVNSHHGCTVGDVDVKASILKCGMPTTLFRNSIKNQLRNDEYINMYDVSETIIAYTSCSYKPQIGNKNKMNKCVCINCEKVLLNAGIPAISINTFVKYFNALETQSKETQKNNANDSMDIDDDNRIDSFNFDSLSNDNKKKFDAAINIINKRTNLNRKSNRISNKTLANLNESIQFDADNQKLNVLENIVDDTVNSIILDNDDIINEIIEEREKPDKWDAVGGCRKTKHVTLYMKLKKAKEKKKDFVRTGGVFAIRTCTGFILNIKIIDRRETSTEIILDYGNYFSSSQDRTAYFKRILGVGYDMACKILSRTLSLLQQKLLPHSVGLIWLPLLSKIFVDKMHVKGHTLDICQSGGFLNPYHARFHDVLSAANTQIAEQGWSNLNRYHFFKSLSREKAAFFLKVYQLYVNQRLQHEYEEEGWLFIPIEFLKIMQTYNPNHQIPNIIPSVADIETDVQNKVIQKLEIKRSKEQKTRELWESRNV